jgi:hypothetical protein
MLSDWGGTRLSRLSFGRLSALEISGNRLSTMSDTNSGITGKRRSSRASDCKSVISAEILGFLRNSLNDNDNGNANTLDLNLPFGMNYNTLNLPFDGGSGQESDTSEGGLTPGGTLGTRGFMSKLKLSIIDGHRVARRHGLGARVYE